MGVNSFAVKNLDCIDISDMKLPGIVIYDHPLDCPDYYVARVWEMSVPAPTNVYILRKDIAELRKEIISDGRFANRIGRSPQDKRSIVETWI